MGPSGTARRATYFPTPLLFLCLVVDPRAALVQQYGKYVRRKRKGKPKKGFPVHRPTRALPSCGPRYGSDLICAASSPGFGSLFT